MNNGKIKIIWWLLGITTLLIGSYVNYVITTQKLTDTTQNAEIHEIRSIVMENNKQLGIILNQINKVNIIELNASVQSLSGTVIRIERKLDL